MIESKRSPSSPWGTFVGTWQGEEKPIWLMTRTKLHNHLSNIQYINKPLTTNTKDSGGEAKEKSEIAVLASRQESNRSESVVSPRSVQLEEAKDDNSIKSLSPSRPESRMGLPGTQSPLRSVAEPSST